MASVNPPLLQPESKGWPCGCATCCAEEMLETMGEDPVNCYPECNGECDANHQHCPGHVLEECSHDSWMTLPSGGIECSDCGEYNPMVDFGSGHAEAKLPLYAKSRAAQLPYLQRMRDNLAPYVSGIELCSPGELRVTDPVTGGQKGQKPERHGLVPQWPQDEVARVYGYGAEKYEPSNWRKGYSWTLSLDALGRHVAKFRSGESTDPESGLHHLAHAQFHLNTLMEFERLSLGTDDRVDLDGEGWDD